MPIPSVLPDEEENKFINRCMRQIVEEYGQSIAAGICYNQYRKKEEMSKKEDLFVIQPRKAEGRGQYLSRCSNNQKMREQYPNMKERSGFCLNSFNEYYKYWNRLEMGEIPKDSALGSCIAEQKSKGFDYREAYAICSTKVVAPNVDIVLGEDNLLIEPVSFEECPPATLDIPLNIENRQKCIDQANYGPLDPNLPNDAYWKKKADQFNTTPQEAKKALCGNCSFFIKTKDMLECIAEGIGKEGNDPYDSIKSGELGYCEAYDFKCASSRTCDAWVVGGPIVDDFAVVGPRGGIKASPKAPKSKTPNEDPKGKGSAKGDASGKRGAVVTAAQEKTLQGKVDDFNEKDSNTKNGRATLGALKSVFQRGLGAYNTSHSPLVRSAEQWSYARVNAFLYLIKHGRPQNPKYTTDYDLLPKGHPKSDK